MLIISSHGVTEGQMRERPAWDLAHSRCSPSGAFDFDFLNTFEGGSRQIT